MARFCSQCGAEIPEGASFCPKCGAASSPVVATVTEAPKAPTNPNASPKSRGIAILLCIFVGGLGIHRFYVGKIGTGILWLLTGGIFGIGALIDFIMILVGAFKDKQERYVANW